jgi:hypothetical protein
LLRRHFDGVFGHTWIYSFPAAACLKHCAE